MTKETIETVSMADRDSCCETTEADCGITPELTEFMLEEIKAILAIDSPTGYTDAVADFLCQEYEKIGCKAVKTQKGGVLVDLGGRDDANGLLLEAHTDTLGAMVAEIKGDGRMRLSRLGGMEPNNGESENCTIYTRDGRCYEGTFQLINASIHVNSDYSTEKRNYDTMELVLDEDVSCKEDVKALGIMNGDIVAFDPRTRITSSGYIKSRFLDDKYSCAILLAYAKYLKDSGKIPERHIYQHITVYEEVGHGACGTVPEGVTEVLSVDMGCVGEGLECTERQVSICAKDSRGPYNYQMTSRLIEAARKTGADFAVDIYPHYGSDADVVLTAGFDVRHGLIGPGIYASHGYERGHIEGGINSLKVLIGFTL